MSTRKAKSKSQDPFYVPTGHKRTMQIIKEAKVELKKMESHRPVTPFSSRISASGIRKDRTSLSRSSSCASIKSLKYEKCSPRSTRHSLLNMEAEGHRLKLEPLVTKPSILSHRVSTHTTKAQIKSDFKGFPPITDDARAKGDATQPTRSYPEGQATQSEGDFLEHPFGLLCETFNNASLLGSSNLSISKSVDEEISESEECAQTSIEIAALFPNLERIIKSGDQKDEGEAVQLVSKIHATLRAKGVLEKSFDKRIPLLKYLFKLLDCNFPLISLHVSKLLLEMKLKDKNSASVFRFCLRLSKENGVDFGEPQLLDSLVGAVRSVSIFACKEAVFYGIAMLKKLILRKTVERCVAVEKVLPTLLHHVNEINLALSSTKKYDHFYGQVMTQVFGILHCLVEDESARGPLVAGLDPRPVLQGLCCCSPDADVVHLILRFMSKLADRSEDCGPLIECSDELAQLFLPLLDAYKYNVDVVLQVSFIAGNVVSADAIAALRFVGSRELCSSLLAIFREYRTLYTQGNKRRPPPLTLQRKSSSEDHDWQADILEVILKVLRIWANACLHAEAGFHLATEQDVVLHLLSAVVDASAHGEADEDALLQSLLVVLGNISYYLSAGSELCLEIARGVFPLLDKCDGSETRCEALSIARNLTRSGEVRLYVRQQSLLAAFVQLSGEEEELATIAYGVLMNLMLDEETRLGFYHQQGISQVLHRLHLCVDRDWAGLALLCQLLWNYCSGEEVMLARAEADHLVKFLTYATGKDPNEEDDAWKHEFCPVAGQLLRLLEKNLS